jgi:pimeloyl-ACP methyl ester carboxylesterase
MATDTLRNVVLVHGGFVDGSGWQGVYESLTRDGFRVSIVQNPTLSLDGDAAATRWILDAQDGPAVLVGHSYGGAIITEAGTHPNVAALVYVCAFAPDKDESVGSLIAGFPADGPQPPILPPRDGFLLLDRPHRPGRSRPRRPVATTPDTACTLIVTMAQPWTVRLQADWCDADAHIRHTANGLVNEYYRAG